MGAGGLWRGDRNRLLLDLRHAALANDERGVITAERLIAQFALPASNVEHVGAFCTRDGPVHRVIVQTELHSSLEASPDGVSSLEYPARCYSNSVLGERLC